MKLFIAGDFCPVNRVKDEIHNGHVHEVFSFVKRYISESDYSIVNLECPIIKRKPKYLINTRPSLYSDESALFALQELGIKCVTLANNHLKDCCEEGIVSTIKSLKEYDFDFVGGGLNLQDAQKVLYKAICGKIIGIVNFCEHEFSIATDLSAGSAPLDLIDNYHQIKEARSNADYVIVIIHGGSEHYQLPSPRMKKTYHWFVDIGADVVVNHHQHCISGVETYNDRPIFYGLGNFCFDHPGLNKPLWKYGMAVNLDVSDNGFVYKLIPFCQCDETPSIRELSIDEYNEFKSQINNLSGIIRDDAKLMKSYYDYLPSRYAEMELPLTPYSNRYLLSAYIRNLLPSFITKKRIMPMLNHVECESHRDIFIHYLQNLLFN